MENPQFETPKPSEVPTFAFPPHRRRPLKSQTYLSVVQFFSLCKGDKDSQRPHSLQTLYQEPKQGKVNEDRNLEDPGHADMSNKISVEREKLVNKSRENIDSLEKDCSNEVNTADNGIADGIANNLDITRGNTGNAADSSIAALEDSSRNQSDHSREVMETDGIANNKDMTIGSVLNTDDSSILVVDSSLGNKNWSDYTDEAMEIDEVGNNVDITRGNALNTADTSIAVVDDSSGNKNRSDYIHEAMEIDGVGNVMDITRGNAVNTAENRIAVVDDSTGNKNRKDCSHEVMESDGVGNSIDIARGIAANTADNIIVVEGKSSGNKNQSDCWHEVTEIDGVVNNVDIIGGNAVKTADNSTAILKDSLGNNNQRDHYYASVIGMEESENIVISKLNKNNCIDKFCDAINPSLGINLTSECSRITENDDKDNSPSVNRNFPGDVEQELEWKETELEKLMSGSCGVGLSSVCPTADDEIEEGEFSCDPALYGQLVELLFEDSVPSDNKIVDNVQISEGIADKKRAECAGQAGALQKNTESTSLLVSSSNDVGNGMKAELCEKSGNEMDHDNNKNEVERWFDMPACANTIEVHKADGDAERYDRRANDLNNSPANAETLNLHKKIIGENAIETQGTIDMDAGVQSKKKKRGPATKEKKAKKKKKERIKRAEKNRKLGVKRLKLKPISKPKTVAYCRHYLKGRCKEGDKCKFSHDTVPLTKSMPCCHFARHSCMKGDTCPFDHQLSKYPCNNIVSKGSCSRGADCLFSHEVPVRDGSSVTPTIARPERNSLTPVSNSNADRKLNLHDTQANAKTSAIDISSSKRTEQSVATNVLKTTSEVPKGISFFMQGFSLVSDSSRHKHAESSKKVDDNVKVGQQIVKGVAEVVQKSKEITKKEPAIVPKGINFLAFGKAPVNDSSSKKPVSLPFNKVSCVDKSPFGDFGKEQLVGTSLKTDDGVNVDNQTGQVTSDGRQNLHEITDRRPPSIAPRGIHFLSFGKASLDGASNKKESGLQFNPSTDVPLSANERQNVPNKPQNAYTVPQRLPFCLFSSAQSLDQLTEGYVRSTPSSSHASFQSNTSSSVQKALQSTLACASKFECEIKIAQSVGASDAGASETKSMESLKIVDFIYGGSRRAKNC